MYPRLLTPIIKELLSEFRIVYLTGPRQASKTTLASAENDPRGFIQSLGERRLVLDEFQYAPGLVLAIKEASDKLMPDEKGKFLLAGSADIFRSAKTQEALPGHMAQL